MTLEPVDDHTFAPFTATGTSVIYFHAEWAPPARVMKPDVEAVAGQLAGAARFGLVDADADPALAERWISALPALCVFRDGALIARVAGQLGRDRIVAELAKAGVGAAPGEQRASPTEAAPAPTLQDRWQTAIAGLRAVSRDELAEQLRTRSAAAKAGVLGQLHVDAALRALHELPLLVVELNRLLVAEGTPFYRRIGALAGLYYAVSPEDAVADELPGGYGHLDDWLVLASTRWLYAREPAPAEVPDLAAWTSLVWMCLPPETIAPLAHLIAQMERERASLMQRDEGALILLFTELIKQPVPVRFPVPPAPPAATGPGGGAAANLTGWSTNAAGAIWGDGRSTYLRFEGGGSVGMTASGRIVGGP